MCRNGPSRKQGISEVELFKNFEDSISLTAVVTKCERREKSVRRPAVCASVLSDRTKFTGTPGEIYKTEIIQRQISRCLRYSEIKELLGNAGTACWMFSNFSSA